MTERIEWMCDACGLAVEDGTGYVHIDHQLALHADHIDHQWRGRHAAMDGGSAVGASAGGGADQVEWRVHHSACDPEVHSHEYWFTVERARTFADLLFWTLHLHETVWVTRMTNWDEFVKAAAERAGGVVP